MKDEATFLFLLMVRELPGISSVSQLAGSPVCGGVIIKRQISCNGATCAGDRILTSALLQYIWQFVGMCDGVADQLLYW